MAEKIVRVNLSTRATRKHPQLIYFLQSGRRIDVTLKTLFNADPEDVALATEIYDQKRRQIALGMLTADDEVTALYADMPLHEFERQFIGHRQKLVALGDVSALSVIEDKKAFRVLKNFMSHGVQIGAINPEFVKLFVNRLRTATTNRHKPYSNQTINKFLRTLSAAFNWAIQQKYITENYFAAFGKLKVNRPQDDINAMRMDQVDVFRQYFETLPHARWQLPAFLFALNTLCRAGSVVRARYSDIYSDTVDGVPMYFIRLIEKRNTSRDVPLFDEALNAINMMRQLAENPDEMLAALHRNKSHDIYRQRIADGYIFFPITTIQTTSKMMLRASRTLMRSGQISGAFKFHDLRDTGATYLLENGIPIETVSYMLGHSNIRTTQNHYAKLTATMAARQIRHLPGIVNFDNKESFR